ncbi:MAG: FkbM family methyltransferase, partial [Bacteroidota bacterium]
MNKKRLLKNLLTVENLASSSKIKRMMNNPVKYLNAILFRELTYKSNKKPRLVRTTTFFGRPMSVLLPSSTDIYLTGGKSHSSEIRLARFIIKHLNEGDFFVDVGAHYGYFTQLASCIV